MHPLDGITPHLAHIDDVLADLQTESDIQAFDTRALRFTAKRDGRDVWQALLYVIYNNNRDKVFGFLSDVYVEEAYRGEGIGTALLRDMIETAKKIGCYKIVGTSRYERPKVHALYERLGFQNWGVEFRMNCTED